MRSLISCIIPTCNGSAFLPMAIDSLLRQSWSPLEVIVVDDGSTDDSFALAAAFGPPVRVVRIAVANPVAARNHGLSLARGRFVAFLDHDDVSAADRLAAQASAFEQDRALDVCVGMVQRFSQAAPDAPMRPIGVPVPGYLTIAMLARREVFAKVGPLDPARRFSDSAEWFLRARALGCRVRLLPDVVTHHRVHGRNLSLVENDGARRDFLHLLRDKLKVERARS